MRFRRSYEEEPEVNLIPLIDVLLIVLIFLAVSTTYSRFAELKIQLPSADATTPAPAAERRQHRRHCRWAIRARKDRCWRHHADGLAEELAKAARGQDDAAGDQRRRAGAAPVSHQRDGGGAPGRDRPHQFRHAARRGPPIRVAVIEPPEAAVISAWQRRGPLAWLLTPLALLYGCAAGASRRVCGRAGCAPSASACRWWWSATCTPAAPARRR